MNTKKGPQKAKKESRVKIPAPVQLKLWMKSGGRCQFTSCPKYLWEEGLTLNEGNYAHIAHIVAQSPDGMRGDKVKSAQLAGDYENLMLMCFEHHKLIDGPTTWMKFPVDDLKKMKKSHEEFVAALHKTPKQNIRTVIRFR
ncbi:HNH endonuclease, partial [Patescibacteria group bacterium]|nr:HNH endonuclease [Patescibacteria group bacterium]